MDNINVLRVINALKKPFYLLEKKINVLKIVNLMNYININIMENAKKNDQMEP